MQFDFLFPSMVQKKKLYVVICGLYFFFFLTISRNNVKLKYVYGSIPNKVPLPHKQILNLFFQYYCIYFMMSYFLRSWQIINNKIRLFKFQVASQKSVFQNHPLAPMCPSLGMGCLKLNSRMLQVVLPNWDGLPHTILAHLHETSIQFIHRGRLTQPHLHPITTSCNQNFTLSPQQQ